ncbi:rotatin-like [Eriocheir sinensis]|uniref:rotatin-like n=1 Tax=Eriocheir sinensis TaxID=95602 RepID=UPI0021C79110|nr:rotatin-like [Eriocheir sinensis]
MAGLADTIRKLVHPIVEIRTRALDSLVQKVELGLVTRAELASSNPPLVHHLLKLLHLGPPSTTTKPLLTLLLLLAEDEGSRVILAGPVVRQQLRELHSVVPVDLLPKVTLLLKKLGHTANNCTASSEERVTEYEEAPDAPDLCLSHPPDPQCLRTDEYAEEGACAESLCDWTRIQDTSVTTAAGESALHFITFPWQALTKSDQHVLESSVRSLMSAGVAEVKAALLFLDTVVVRDFPPEVLLQRPAVLQVVYGCLEEQGEDAHYFQGPACDLLHSLTKLLTARVHHFTDPHSQPGSGEVVSTMSSGVTSPSNLTQVSCCSPHTHTAPYHGPPDTLAGGGEPQPFSGVGQELLGSTIHEQDDGDEFILLGLHQMTVPSHCVRAMRAATSLLASRRPDLQSASLRLMSACITLLRDCVHPSMLWRVLVEGEPCEEEEEAGGEELLATEVKTGILMVIGTLSDLILTGLEARKEARGERWLMVTHCCSLFLCHVLTTLVPAEAAVQVIDNAVCDAVVMVLCDGGFFLQHPEHHHTLLQYLTQANPTSANEVRCLLFAAKSLEATSNFLKASNSDLQGFLDLAEKSLPSCSVLQDATILEKLLWGVGRQAKEGSVSEEQLEQSRHILLQCLHSPVLSVRLYGYKSVLRLVESSVGATQTLDTSCSRSPAVLILLSPDVIRFILFAGCADDNKEVANIARESLLTLLLGRPLMSSSVWTVAAKCWGACLPDLQCLADPSSSLGRAVDQTFEAVCDKDSPEALRYQLQCLFLLRREARSGPFFQSCQKLKHMIPDLCFDSLRYSITVHNDLFILRQPIHIMRTCNLEAEEGGLLKVVELIHGGGTEATVQKAAWTQLAFLLEDPNLHKAFMRLCSLPFLVQTFINSLKRGEGEGVRLECVPRVVECLRLLATHSAEVRLTLLQDPTFLTALLGATLLFYEDMRMRSQASCLMALVLFQDLISFWDTLEEIGATQLPSVPQLLAKGLHLPFLHRTHPWGEDRGLCTEMRAVHHLLKEAEWPAREFLGAVWDSCQAGGVEWLSARHYQDSKDSDCLILLNERETAWLRLSILSLATTSALRNVENATSHHDVKKNVAALSFRVQQLALAGCCDKDFFISAQWRSSFQRFLTSEPNSSVDEQLLVHILECLCTCLKVHSQVQDARSSLIKLLVTELTNPSSALLHTLGKAGGTSWVASDFSLQAVQTVRLFRAAAGLVACTLSLLSEGKAGFETFCEDFWDKLANAVTSTLLPILSANNDLQHYNVAVVGMALEVLVHISLNGWPGMDLASQLVSNSVRLISSFHLGRGLAHNSYVGRRVTLNSSLVLLHLFSHLNTDFSQVIQEASGEDSLSWLVSLWVYRDPLVASCGLNVAAALAAQTSLLHYNLTQVSGGVWAAALSYFLPEGRGCLVRASAALLLVQLTRVGPSPSSPWPSPIVADVCTGESVDGLEGLMTLLQHCNFYSLVLTSLSHLSVGLGLAGTSSPIRQEWDLS